MLVVILIRMMELPMDQVLDKYLLLSFSVSLPCLLLLPLVMLLLSVIQGHM